MDLAVTTRPRGTIRSVAKFEREWFGGDRSEDVARDIRSLRPLVLRAETDSRIFRVASEPGARAAASGARNLISAANFATRSGVDTLKVRDAKDVEDVVRAAIANEQPLEIIGHGSKRAIGQVMATNAVLDVSALSAVTSYEPNELIITLQAGAPLADVLSLIDSKNQQFAFEPMNTAPLLGTPGLGTVGGM